MLNRSVVVNKLSWLTLIIQSSKQNRALRRNKTPPLGGFFMFDVWIILVLIYKFWTATALFALNQSICWLDLSVFVRFANYAETLNFLKKNTANAVFLENSWLRGMDLATLARSRCSPPYFRLALAGGWTTFFVGSNPATGIKQKTHHKGTFFILTGCGGWIWTNDLQVMSLTSYRTALPRDKVCVLYIIYDNSQIKNCLCGFWGLFLVFLELYFFVC